MAEICAPVARLSIVGWDSSGAAFARLTRAKSTEANVASDRVSMLMAGRAAVNVSYLTGAMRTADGWRQGDMLLRRATGVI